SALAGHKSMKVRMNAAIAAAQVAAKVGNDRLAHVSQLFMKDMTEPVALWGVKAARAVIPAAARQTKPAVRLEGDVVATVKAHSESGPILEEAYAALTLRGDDTAKAAAGTAGG